MLRDPHEVAAEVLATARPVSETETVALSDAQGRYLAVDVTSPINVPPADNSAMDGYALRAGSVASGEWLDVSARIAAGQAPEPLAPGTVARIFTGAVVPEGADAVVIQENVEVSGERIRIAEMPVAGENVRAAGQDVRAGDLALAKGTRLTAQCVALLASIGVSQVQVARRLRVAVLSSGDELIEPGEPQAPGKIYNSNRYLLAGLLQELGMEVQDVGIVRDTPQATEAALVEASGADCILSSGGVSVGEEDHVKAAVERLGKLHLWKLAIKPGKPLAFGEVQGVPFFGLPGNPVSGFVTFKIIAAPYLVRQAGGCHEPRMYAGQADFEFAAGSRREFIRVKTCTGDDQVVRLSRFANQGSGVMTSVVWGDALAEIAPGQQVQPGDKLTFHPY